MNYNIVMPIVRRNLEVLKINMPYLLKNVEHVKKIVLIGSQNIQEECLQTFPMCQFIDEDKLIEGLSYSKVEEIISSIDKYAVNRTGWYLQQFIKFAYGLICEEEYYLLWDADTIPLRKISMFDESNNPCFDMKYEYNIPYFTTSKRLIGIGKVCPDSFLSEHILFKTEYVKELIDLMESNRMIEGEKFFEKILYAIRKIDLAESGFAESEIYGNFVLVKHSGVYHMRKFPSLRNGEKYLGRVPTKEMLEWAEKSYPAIAFENRRDSDPKIASVINTLMKEKSLQEVVDNDMKVFKKNKD